MSTIHFHHVLAVHQQRLEHRNHVAFCYRLAGRPRPHRPRDPD